MDTRLVNKRLFPSLFSITWDFFAFSWIPYDLLVLDCIQLVLPEVGRKLPNGNYSTFRWISVWLPKTVTLHENGKSTWHLLIWSMWHMEHVDCLTTPLDIWASDWKKTENTGLKVELLWATRWRRQSNEGSFSCLIYFNRVHFL